MTSATNDKVFDLIHAAILKLRDMESVRDCDSLELSEAFALLIKARGLVRPVSLMPKPGYVLCPGTYSGKFTRISERGPVGICRHCHTEMRIVMYGKYLRQHYVPLLTDEAAPTPTLLRGSPTEAH